MTKVSGCIIKGVSIQGRAFLAPTDIVNCEGWWKWKTGITLDASLRLQQWNDQSSHGRHLSQATGVNRPAYNQSTGIITPDGVDDFLNCAISPPTSGEPELTFVIKTPASPSGIIWSKETATAIDADAIKLAVTVGYRPATSKNVSAISAVSSNTLLSASSIQILSISPGFIAINGDEVQYINKTKITWAGASQRRFVLFAEVRNASGNATTPINFSNVEILEWCWHQSKLNSLQRSKLIAYFRNTHNL